MIHNNKKFFLCALFVGLLNNESCCGEEKKGMLQLAGEVTISTVLGTGLGIPVKIMLEEFFKPEHSHILQKLQIENAILQRDSQVLQNLAIMNKELSPRQAKIMSILDYRLKKAQTQSQELQLKMQQLQFDAEINKAAYDAVKQRMLSATSTTENKKTLIENGLADAFNDEMVTFSQDLHRLLQIRREASELSIEIMQLDVKKRREELEKRRMQSQQKSHSYADEDEEQELAEKQKKFEKKYQELFESATKSHNEQIDTPEKLPQEYSQRLVEIKPNQYATRSI